MKLIGQVAILCIITVSVVIADEPKDLGWKSPEIGAGAFTDDLGMFDRERDEYADNLAIYAINDIAKAKASKESLEKGRKYIALALHLAPRNKHALVANYQLKRGIIPKSVHSDYSPEVLAGLLSVRAQTLNQQGGDENRLLARAFIELAAELHPENEDIVYAGELQRIDHGEVNWSAFTDAKKGNGNN